LVMAFRLNEASLIRQVFEAIPHTSISLVIAEMPVVYLQRLIRFVGTQAEESPHLEFCLLWVQAIFDSHGQWIRDNRGTMDSELRVVIRSVGRIREEFTKLADENCFMIDYLLSQPANALQNGGLDGVKTITNSDVHVMDVDNEESEGEWIGLD